MLIVRNRVKRRLAAIRHKLDLVGGASAQARPTPMYPHHVFGKIFDVGVVKNSVRGVGFGVEGSGLMVEGLTLRDIPALRLLRERLVGHIQLLVKRE